VKPHVMLVGSLVAYVGTDDSTTRQLLERILAQEEEHAKDLAGLLDDGMVV
jgi:bacterioferritin